LKILIKYSARPASYCAYTSLRHFFLQKKHITAIKRLRLAGSIQILPTAKLLLIAMLGGIKNNIYGRKLIDYKEKELIWNFTTE